MSANKSTISNNMPLLWKQWSNESTYTGRSIIGSQDHKAPKGSKSPIHVDPGLIPLLDNTGHASVVIVACRRLDI